MKTEDKLKKLRTKVNNNNLDILKKVISINVEKLKPSQNNFYSIDGIEDLAESIRINGQIQPILIRSIEDNKYEYELIDGERRYQASLLAGKHEIEAIIVEESNEDKIYLMLIEANHQREKTPTDKAREYKERRKLYERLGYDSIRDKIEDDGISKKQQSRYNKVLKLNDENKGLLDSGALTMRDIDKININDDAKNIDEQFSSILNEKKSKQLSDSKTDEEKEREKAILNMNISSRKLDENQREQIIKMFSGFINNFENEDILVAHLKNLIQRIDNYIPKK